MAQVLLISYRNIGIEPGYVEYSWVPEGKRLNLEFHPDDTIVSQKHQVQYKISQIEIYQLQSDKYSLDFGNKPWQIPPKAGASVAIYCTIGIFEDRAEVVSTVYFADGSHASERKKLK
jgi:hypothetical protein